MLVRKNWCFLIISLHCPIWIMKHEKCMAFWPLTYYNFSVQCNLIQVVVLNIWSHVVKCQLLIFNPSLIRPEFCKYYLNKPINCSNATYLCFVIISFHCPICFYDALTADVFLFTCIWLFNLGGDVKHSSCHLWLLYARFSCLPISKLFNRGKIWQFGVLLFLLISNFSLT